MAFLHYLYLSLYMECWVKTYSMQASEKLNSDMHITSLYDKFFKEYVTDSSKTYWSRLEEDQIKFLRLNYIFLVNFFA